MDIVVVLQKIFGEGFSNQHHCNEKRGLRLYTKVRREYNDRKEIITETKLFTKYRSCVPPKSDNLTSSSMRYLDVGEDIGLSMEECSLQYKSVVFFYFID